MRELRTAGFLILTSMLWLFGAGTASADISLDVDIKNRSCDSSGDDVHARAGDRVCARLKLKNDSKDPVTMQLRIMGGIPSCMIDSTLIMAFDGKESRRGELCRIVPEGLDGEMFIIVASAEASDGCRADDCAKLTFGTRDDDDDDDDWDDDEGDDDDGNDDEGDDDDGDDDGDDDDGDDDDDADRDDRGDDGDSAGSHGPFDGGVLRRAVARALARSVVLGLVPDRTTTTVEADFSDVKQLYR